MIQYQNVSNYFYWFFCFQASNKSFTFSGTDMTKSRGVNHHTPKWVRNFNFFELCSARVNLFISVIVGSASALATGSKSCSW